MDTTPRSLRVRAARVDDVPTVVRLLAADSLGVTREADPVDDLDVYLAAFAELDASPRTTLAVGEAPVDGVDRVVACLQLDLLRNLTYRGGLRAQVEGVRVASEVRGRGYGEQLLVWAIEAAREAGAHLVQLTTDTRRPDARRFYERLGFVASHTGMKLHLDA